MAASGIQEHNEARRKEMRYLRAAKRDKEMKAAIASGQVQMMYPEHNSNNNNQHGTSYERELQSRSQCRVVGSPPGIRGGGTDAVSVDRYGNGFSRLLQRPITPHLLPKSTHYPLPIPLTYYLPCCADIEKYMRPISPCINKQVRPIQDPNRRRLCDKYSRIRAPYFNGDTDQWGQRCRLPINEDRCRNKMLDQGLAPYRNCTWIREDDYLPYYMQRRMEHYNQQQQEYSAKIPGRFRNFDYTSQW